MRKTVLAATAMVFVVSITSAQAMSLGAVRPNVIRAAALGQSSLPAQRAGLTQLISMALSACESLPLKLVRQMSSDTSAAAPGLSI